MKFEIHPTKESGPFHIDSYIVYGKVCAVAQALYSELRLARTNLSMARMQAIRDTTEAKLQGIRFLREHEPAALEKFIVPHGWDSDPVNATGFLLKISARLGTIVIHDQSVGLLDD